MGGAHFYVKLRPQILEVSLTRQRQIVKKSVSTPTFWKVGDALRDGRRKDVVV